MVWKPRLPASASPELTELIKAVVGTAPPEKVVTVLRGVTMGPVTDGNPERQVALQTMKSRDIRFIVLSPDNDNDFDLNAVAVYGQPYQSLNVQLGYVENSGRYCIACGACAVLNAGPVARTYTSRTLPIRYDVCDGIVSLPPKDWCEHKSVFPFGLALALRYWVARGEKFGAELLHYVGGQEGKSVGVRMLIRKL